MAYERYYGESEVRDLVEKTLRKIPMYNHRLSGRARNIVLSAIMDEAYEKYLGEKQEEIA